MYGFVNVHSFVFVSYMIKVAFRAYAGHLLNIFLKGESPRAGLTFKLC